MRTSASGPLVIHIFEPLAIQRSPFLSARQAMEPTTSEPAPGSLIASAPTNSPEQSFGQVLAPLRLGAVEVEVVHAQVRVRAVGEPHRGRGARDFLHRHHVGEVAQARAAVLLRAPSCPAGPCSPSFAHMSAGNSLARSMSAARGASSASHRRRVAVAKRVELLREIHVERQVVSVSLCAPGWGGGRRRGRPRPQLSHDGGGASSPGPRRVTWRPCGWRRRGGSPRR